MADGYRDLVGFGAALRDAGLRVGPARMVDFCRATALGGPGELYWSGRLTLVSRQQDLATYDRVFGDYFGGMSDARAHTAVQAVDQTCIVDVHQDVERLADEPEGVASAVEVLRRKDFAAFTPDELIQLVGLLQALDFSPPQRRSRRWRSARRGRPDLRRTARGALRAAGEPTIWHTRVRRLRERRLILILDVSHSMADYARVLLMFAHARLRSRAPVEVFCFGTRLTHLTAMLARAEPRDVLTRAADLVLDWDGGTRIGDSLKQFLDGFGHSGLARGAVVVICSDGLETGDPAVLGEQMARLSRLAHLVVWLNPLSANVSYQPLARGMQAALPYVDVFASGHDLANLETLRTVLASTIGRRSPVQRFSA
jgi:uncharacterized protein with von Willebrand factor type A (vWA) domain